MHSWKRLTRLKQIVINWQPTTVSLPPLGGYNIQQDHQSITFDSICRSILASDQQQPSYSHVVSLTTHISIRTYVTFQLVKWKCRLTSHSTNGFVYPHARPSPWLIGYLIPFSTWICRDEVSIVCFSFSLCVCVFVFSRSSVNLTYQPRTRVKSAALSPSNPPEIFSFCHIPVIY